MSGGARAMSPAGRWSVAATATTLGAPRITEERAFSATSMTGYDWPADTPLKLTMVPPVFTR